MGPEQILSYGSTVVEFMIIVLIIVLVRRARTKKMYKSLSAMPHEHTQPGKYQTYNKKRMDNSAGAQPHKHETRKYTSMSDASKLPKGYILLNGEPVKVSDLDNK